MDFITHVPKTKCCLDSTTTFVYHLTKLVYFLLSYFTYSALEFGRCFFDTIFFLHGLPYSLGSDRDLNFKAKFENSLMNPFKIRLKMHTSDHLQTDGFSEVMN